MRCPLTWAQIKRDILCFCSSFWSGLKETSRQQKQFCGQYSYKHPSMTTFSLMGQHSAQQQPEPMDQGLINNPVAFCLCPLHTGGWWGHWQKLLVWRRDKQFVNWFILITVHLLWHPHTAGKSFLFSLFIKMLSYVTHEQSDQMQRRFGLSCGRGNSSRSSFS